MHASGTMYIVNTSYLLIIKGVFALIGEVYTNPFFRTESR